MGAQRELECGVQMFEGESKAYQLLVPEGGGLFLVFVADSAGEVISWTTSIIQPYKVKVLDHYIRVWIILNTEKYNN